MGSEHYLHKCQVSEVILDIDQEAHSFCCCMFHRADVTLGFRTQDRGNLGPKDREQKVTLLRPSLRMGQSGTPKAQKAGNLG